MELAKLDKSVSAIKSRFTLTCDMGTFKAGQKAIPVNFPILPPNDLWDLPSDQVSQYIETIAGCGCTEKKWDIGGIKAAYNDDSINNFGNAETFNVAKSMNVYFKDGEPMQIVDIAGNKIQNPNKKYITVTYTGIAIK
jgi:hypothetical protein